LKKSLIGKKYTSDDELISARNEVFGSKNASFIFTGIEAVEHRYQKYITLSGGCFELSQKISK